MYSFFFLCFAQGKALKKYILNVKKGFFFCGGWHFVLMKVYLRDVFFFLTIGLKVAIFYPDRQPTQPKAQPNGQIMMADLKALVRPPATMVWCGLQKARQRETPLTAASKELHFQDQSLCWSQQL